MVIDEAYIDFVTDPDCALGINSLAQRENLLLIRTFSKIHGLAAARVGFGISHAPLINILERVRPPFNVNRIGQAGALASWQDTAYVNKMRELNASNREYLYTLLENAGMSYVPSQANFVLADVKQDADAVCRKLAECRDYRPERQRLRASQHLRSPWAVKKILPASEKFCRTAENPAEKFHKYTGIPFWVLHSYVVLMYNHSQHQCKA